MNTLTELTPVPASARLQVLDVIRGFALLGIFLMNVEFFNRPIAELDLGMPPGVAGVDWWAGWFVHVFVRGKFWTMFSLLFGMGFALMLGRASEAGRGFVAPYLRRTLALAAIGALHYLFLWSGDILFSYAMGAAFLMLVFHARPALLFLIAGVVGVIAGVLQKPELLGLAIPALLFGLLASALRRWPLSGLRVGGLALFLVPFALVTMGGVAQTIRSPQAREAAAITAAKTPAEKQELLEAKKKAEQRHEKKAERVAEERRVMSSGTYPDTVRLRLTTFPQQVKSDLEFTVIIVGMFLLGAWFIRSGVMLRPAEHLALFRRLLWIGLPLGLGLSLVGASIAVTHVRGENDGPFQLAMGLSMLGNLPASLGYVSALVLAFHHPRWRRWVAWLAPAGRMALTNYLLQSLIGTALFYGYGLGHWGMPRAGQLLFVLVVFALQVAFSHWWLARLRYGPMEWLWRALTYLQLPTVRREPLAAA